MAPQVAFHILKKNKYEAYQYLARLVAKAYSLKSSLIILTENADEARRVDDLLWCFADDSFLPHEICHNDESTNTPILISDKELNHKRDVLINLRLTMPTDLNQFQRVIELIYLQDDIKEHGRHKYREYQALGCPIQTFHAEDK